MRILLSGPIEGDLETFYKNIQKQKPHWVVCAGDYGIWPDPQRMDRAAKQWAKRDFSQIYVGAKTLPIIQTLTIAGVHDDNYWLQQRLLANNSEILPGVHWLGQGYRTTIGWDLAIRVTGLGRAYSEASYQETQNNKAFRHYTRHDIERGCSSGPTDLLVIYEHLDHPGIRNLIFATRPKLVLSVAHNNRKIYSEIQQIPIVQLRRHETKLISWDGNNITYLDQNNKCTKCNHKNHEPGKCQTLYFYTRGPNDPPGNQRCLCGYTVQQCHLSLSSN